MQVGAQFSMISRVDGRGRILIPKGVRDSVGLSEGTLISISVEGDSIVIRKVESAADRYYGRFKARRWPEDLDEVLKREAVRWSD